MASRFGRWVRWQRVPVAELGIRSLPHLVAAHWAIDLLPAVSAFVGARF